MRRVYLRWIDWRRETVIRVEEGKWGMVRRRTTTPKVGRGGMMGGEEEDVVWNPEPVW